MKKFFAICSMVVALGFVAGCPGGDKPAPTNSTPSATDATTDDAAPTDAPADTAPAGDATPSE